MVPSEGSRNAAKRPELERPHGPGALADHECNLLDAEVAEDTKEHDLRLNGRQEPRDRLDGIVGRQTRKCILLHVAPGTVHREESVGRWLNGTGGGSSQVVDQPAASDREHEPAKVLFAALEAEHAAGNVDPGLLREVLRLRRAFRSKVAEQRWLEILVQRGYRPVGTGSGSVK